MGEKQQQQPPPIIAVVPRYTAFAQNAQKTLIITVLLMLQAWIVAIT
jgi:hypothetical protein